VVLEHQFWDLAVEEERFAVTLSFQNKPERLVIPFEAILSFADPAVKFGLQFQQAAAANQEGQSPDAAEPLPESGTAAPPAKSGDKGADVVNIDKFRKK